jgi:mRNA interferase RelE/StbE
MRGLERNTARRVRQAVLRVSETGRGDVVKMQGRDREWRLRVGDYRVRLTFEFQTQTIRVLRVRHRREAYR